jgi:nucleotide-binding universal stress UspA family protein
MSLDDITPGAGVAMTPARGLHVLVPLDATAHAAAILPHVRALAPAAVTLFRLLDEGDEPGARVAAEAHLAHAAAALRRQMSGHVRWILRSGAPAAEIVRAAGELEVGLVALATHGRSGLDRLLDGSVAEDVARAAPVPVLALRPTAIALDDAPPPSPFERIVVPYDGSPCAWRAVEALARLGAARRGRLTLLGVVEERVASLVGPPTPGGREACAGSPACERIREELGFAASRARERGFHVATDLEFGPPAATILEWAAQHEPTLIAMATHARRGLARLALGSVTEAVLRGAHGPLLICR